MRLALDPARLVDGQATGRNNHADLLQTDPGHVWRSARGDQHPFAIQLGTVLHPQAGALAVRLRSRWHCAQAYVDPLLAQRLSERSGHARLLGPQQLRSPLDERHRGAEPGVDLGQLASGRAPADHDQRRRAFGRGKGLVGSPRRDLAQARHRRAHGRAAGADDEIPVAVPDAADLDAALGHHTSPAPENAHAQGIELGHLGGIVAPVHDAVAPAGRPQICRVPLVGATSSPAAPRSTARPRRWRTWAERRRALLGTQDTKGHSPPTRPASTTATDRPALASRRAAAMPA